jgi:hypothetical protein
MRQYHHQGVSSLFKCLSNVIKGKRHSRALLRGVLAFWVAEFGGQDRLAPAK